MADIKLGLIESRFADIIWESEPLATKKLVSLCEKQLNWKRTTTYTVLKKLCERGIFKTENSIVTSTMSKEEFYAIQSEQFVDETFKGSLPAFIAAFTKRKNLTEKEIDEIKQMIDSFKGD
ncbi:MAG: BlaI/MecI/CopY family transcriptional regulator [Clostridia bacterium]|nr:BlaI/MecI/CopY family transcriptional regulator [Clostridia bacterium]